jgi:hypothetical protein
LPATQPSQPTPDLDPAGLADPAHPAAPAEVAGLTAGAELAEEPADPAAGLSRRERRAAARGKTAADKVAGPATTRLRPPPPGKRNYATRKGG